ncbi:variant erythrocyte surface antigen-1 family protein [Babesia caballi]|uniref:Variant erythrocyte surface antigen-1 family protein n=1 Tax=Babesia caballi TaxID=5871 RepID=A0AAV4LX99_BABCB|nr:variant erythrocyte surface antigen-1 family protein [Babesia caballi]
MTLDSFTETFSKKFTGLSADSLIKDLAKGLGSGFLGYSSQNGSEFNGEGIVKQEDSKYQSTYKDADWDRSDEPTYAKIFLFLAPLVYYFITFLYWASKDKWRNKTIESRGSVSALYYFMVAMGYSQPQLNEKKTGSQIADRLGGHYGFSELKEAYGSGGSSSYSTFIEKLEEDGPTKKLDYPLTNCKIFSYEYLKSWHNAAEITKAIDSIKEELKELSTSSDISSTGNFSALQQKMKILLEKIKSFEPHSGSSQPGSSEPGRDGLQKAGSSGTGSISQAQSSSAGPAVGGLLGVGALGAGAAYVLNIGGAKTIVHGLLRIG